MTGQTEIQTKVSESDLEFIVRYTIVSSANQGWDEYCAAGKFQWQMPEDACMHTCQLFEISKSEIARGDPKTAIKMLRCHPECREKTRQTTSPFQFSPVTSAMQTDSLIRNSHESYIYQHVWYSLRFKLTQKTFKYSLVYP